MAESFQKAFKMSWILGFLGILLLTSCSSSQPKEEGAEEGPAPPTEAGTDVIPPPSGTPESTAQIPQLPEQQASTVPQAPPSATPPEASQLQATEPTPATSPPAEQATQIPPEAPIASTPTPETQAPIASTPTPETQAPKSESSEASETESYTVQSGDTLMKIAFEKLGDLMKWKEIYKLNQDKLKNPNVLPKGIQLKIQKSGSFQLEKNGTEYLIQSGDTLVKISEKLYGNKNHWKEIYQNNKQLIHDPNKIYAGFYLYYSKPETQATQSSPPINISASTPAPNTPSTPNTMIAQTPSPGTPAAQDSEASQKLPHSYSWNSGSSDLNSEGGAGAESPPNSLPDPKSGNLESASGTAPGSSQP